MIEDESIMSTVYQRINTMSTMKTVSTNRGDNRGELPVDNNTTQASITDSGLWQPQQITPVEPEKTAAQRTPKPRKLTRKQQAFIKHLVDNPKASAKAAAQAAYNVTSERSAETVGSELLRKPEIMAELAKYSGSAEITVIEVMEYSKDKGRILDNGAGASYAATALQAANSLLDRLHGKATQRTESVSTAVNLNLNLSDITSDETT